MSFTKTLNRLCAQGRFQTSPDPGHVHYTCASAVQVTNHVTRSVRGAVQPGLGVSWSHIPRTRLLLERINKSPARPCSLRSISHAPQVLETGTYTYNESCPIYPPVAPVKSGCLLSLCRLPFLTSMRHQSLILASFLFQSCSLQIFNYKRQIVSLLCSNLKYQSPEWVLFESTIL